MANITRFIIRQDDNQEYDKAQAEAYLVRLKKEIKGKKIFRQDFSDKIHFFVGEPAPDGFTLA